MNAHIIPVVLLVSVTSIFAEQRSRFDNFDTANGVQVQYQPSQPEAERPTIPPEPQATSVAPKHYLPSPAVGDDYKKLLALRPVVEERVFVTPTVLVTSTDFDLQTRTPETSRLVMAAGNSLRGFTTGDDAVDAYIVDSSRRYSIDPLLIFAQMRQESSFNRRATSNKGASGLMQLMPATARRMGVSDIYDPQQNIEGGVKYMRLLLDMFGDVNLALAGYNAGEGAVIKYGYQIPPYNETQDYVRRISARYRAIGVPNLAQTAGRSRSE